MTAVAATRGDLNERQWARLAPLLPPQKPAVGRPANDHRTVLNAILWVLRTGAPWRDVLERYGSWKTASSRFYRWRRRGIWDALLKALQTEAERQGELDRDLQYVDGTSVRAHQHAAGAKGGRRARPWAEAVAGSVPRCTSGPREAASPSPS